MLPELHRREGDEVELRDGLCVRLRVASNKTVFDTLGVTTAVVVLLSVCDAVPDVLALVDKLHDGDALEDAEALVDSLQVCDAVSDVLAVVVALRVECGLGEAVSDAEVVLLRVARWLVVRLPVKL